MIIKEILEKIVDSKKILLLHKIHFILDYQIKLYFIQKLKLIYKFQDLFKSIELLKLFKIKEIALKLNNIIYDFRFLIEIKNLGYYVHQMVNYHKIGNVLLIRCQEKNVRFYKKIMKKNK